MRHSSKCSKNWSSLLSDSFSLVGTRSVSSNRDSRPTSTSSSPRTTTEKVVAFLQGRGFERQADLEVPPEETIYNREIELFERTEGLPHPVGVDILVNGLGCRQTEAEWSFDYLRTHSSPTTISGGTRSTTARAADGEVLVAAKLHSGRKTDLADVLAAVPSIDLDRVETHLHRGDADALRQQLSDAQAFIEEGGLDHRFKSMFGQSSASAEDIETFLEFLKRQQQ